MDEINLYPYRVRITDPELIDVFNKVSNRRFCRVKPKTAKKIGHKIPKKVKRDGVIISDGVFTVYNPKIKLDVEPAYGKRKGIDAIFKSLF